MTSQYPHISIRIRNSIGVDWDEGPQFIREQAQLSCVLSWESVAHT
jgi:hypothetical protein